MRKITQRLRQSHFWKSVLMVAGGTVTAQLLNVVASPIITRLYSPDEFGILSVYVSVISIFSVFCTLRFEIAIPIAKDDSQAIHVLLLTVVSVVCVVIAISIPVLFFPNYVTALLNVEELKPFLWLIPFGVFAAGIYTAFRYWAFREKNYKAITRTSVNQSISQIIIQIFWGFAIGGPVGLLLGSISGRSAGIWTLSKGVRQRKGKLKREISAQKLKETAVRFKKFPLVLSWSAVLNSLGLQLPVLILASHYGTEVTGAFGFATKIIAIPMTLVGVAVGEVFFSEAASLAKSDPKRLLSMFNNMNKRLMMIGIVPFSILFLIGPELFSFVFGEPWREAGNYARVMAFMVFSRFVTAPLTNVTLIYEKQLLSLVLNSIRVITVLLSLHISRIIGVDAIITITIYSVSMIFVYILNFITARMVIIKEISRLSSKG